MVEINIYEIIMQVINFLLLLYILKRFLYAPLQKFMDDRQAAISNDLGNAEKNRLEAEKLLEEQKHLLREAKQESLKIREEAEADARQERDEIIKETKEKAQSILKENQDQLASEMEKMKVSLVDYLAETTGALVEKVVAVNSNSESVEQDLAKEIEVMKNS